MLNPMPKKPAKREKKPMTLDRFAVAIQTDLQATRRAVADGFRSIREDMAAEFRTVRDEMRRDFATKAEVRELREDVQRITDAMVTKADLDRLREELLLEIRQGEHVDELRARLTVVEAKLGIKPSRKAA